MNKENKKLKEAGILGALVLLLIGVAIFQLSPKKQAASTPPAPNTATPQTQQAASAPPAAPASSSAPAAKGGLIWVDDHRLLTVIAEVTVGRDPFRDPSAPVVQSSLSTTSSGAKAPSLISASRNTPLESLIPLTSEGMGLIGATTSTETKPFVPPTPPVPNFVLNGVVSTPTARYAAITVNDHYYTLLEGETIPSNGWTVVHVQPYSVLVKKGTQSVSLRLSGGSSK